MLGAFGGDVAGLNAYLEQQQEFIDTMVQQAEGVLASGASSGQPLVARWQTLAADLRRYPLKSPASSRMALETFIAVGSARRSCAEGAAAPYAWHAAGTPTVWTPPFARALRPCR
jgi:hypothetical protein